MKPSMLHPLNIPLKRCLTRCGKDSQQWYCCKSDNDFVKLHIH